MSAEASASERQPQRSTALFSDKPEDKILMPQTNENSIRNFRVQAPGSFCVNHTVRYDSELGMSVVSLRFYVCGSRWQRGRCTPSEEKDLGTWLPNGGQVRRNETRLKDSGLGC